MLVEHLARTVQRRWYVASLPAAVFALAACAGTTTPSTLPNAEANAIARSLYGSGSGKIQHIVYVVQENRSFNDMFEGYPGAYTVSQGKMSNGQTIALQPISLKTSYDIDHSAERNVPGLRREGQAPRNEVQDGRLQSRAAVRRP